MRPGAAAPAPRRPGGGASGASSPANSKPTTPQTGKLTMKAELERVAEKIRTGI